MGPIFWVGFANRRGSDRGPVVTEEYVSKIFPDTELGELMRERF